MDNLSLHIDEPIKRCVVGMALLGFTPIFSCCGFNYEGEKVRKTHLPKPYIYLDHSRMTPEQKALLIDIAFDVCWTIKKAGSMFLDFHGWQWEGEHPWNAEGCPHKPEVAVLAIHTLETKLSNLRSHFKDEVSIVDGNFLYKETLKIRHWQYTPSEPWVVNPVTFEEV